MAEVLLPPLSTASLQDEGGVTPRKGSKCVTFRQGYASEEQAYTRTHPAEFKRGNGNSGPNSPAAYPDGEKAGFAREEREAMTEERAQTNRIPWKPFFAVQDADLPGLPDRLFRVWIVLNMIFARKGYRSFQVSDKRLAELCNVHPDTIKRRVIKLFEHKLIWMERRQGKIPLYRILPVSEFKKFQKYLQIFKIPRKKKNTPLEEKGASSNSLRDVFQHELAGGDIGQQLAGSRIQAEVAKRETLETIQQQVEW